MQAPTATTSTDLMLFDLRGRGRRNTIKVIYVMLAFLMGGGLVLFGIGGDTSGGLVDALTGAGSAPDASQKRFERQEAAALARTRANPSDEAAWAQLVRARVQLATTGERYDANTDTYDAEGKTKLRQAAEAWEKYLALDPSDKEETSRVASLMVRTFVSLEDLDKATIAQEVVADARDAAGPYSQLAVLAYQAGQTRKGDLAAEKAISLTDKDLRESLKAELESAKQQSVVQQVAPTPSPAG
jgi:tetratricopeptide (TPR) repeat protein